MASISVEVAREYRCPFCSRMASTAATLFAEVPVPANRRIGAESTPPSGVRLD
jgi:hypothetical protein